MKWPHASLTDQQVRDTFFAAPEVGDIYAMALGSSGYQQFCKQRQAVRASGGELLLIGWPDGTTVTLQTANPTDIDVETLVQTYRASAAMHRITQRPAQP